MLLTGDEGELGSGSVSGSGSGSGLSPALLALRLTLTPLRSGGGGGVCFGVGGDGASVLNPVGLRPSPSASEVTFFLSCVRRRVGLWGWSALSPHRLFFLLTSLPFVKRFREVVSVRAFRMNLVRTSGAGNLYCGHGQRKRELHLAPRTNNISE
jgi:hypothetical protein